MFYYAEINSEYQVINKHCLSEESTNPNYILITEDLYTNGNDRGDIVGQFYNTLSGVIDKIDPEWDMGKTDWMRYKDSQMKLSTKLDNMDKATSLKADIDHTHEGYANADDLQVLEDVIATKANASHTHTEYAPVTHSHSEYALQTSVNALEIEIDGKADSTHSHTEYALSTHEHDEYAEVGHNHNTSYSPISHSHTEYVTTVDFNALETEVDGKANASHSHNDIYYTETEINDKLATKADSSHNHTGVYDVSGAAASALSSAKTYTDEAIDALSETVDTKANSSTLNSHTGNTAVHITSAERNKLSGIAEGANNYVLPSAGTSLGGVKSGGDVTISSGVITVNDDSHNHVISNVDGLQSALDSKAASGHNHDGVYYTETEVDVLLEGKANSSHNHTISNITNLQSTLDGKANTSHGTHVSYSTTAPVMDGSASVGTASTVARSDHKHPTDTSRAAQTSLDAHTSNKSNPHGVTLAQLGLTATAAELNKMDGVTATTAELNILDGITATTTEINYVDGVTSNIQTQLNAKASSSHTHNTATTSAAGLMSASDKSKLDGIASGANAYTLPTASSTLGGVKTTSTVTSNSGYTACPIIGGVPYYKDTNTTYNLGSFGVTATAAELNALDGITATVTELNYVDGVTSNIQTQLNGKAASSHTHNYAGSSSAGGVATSANKLATARTISLVGDVTGSTSFDGSGNVSITATIADDSHNHTIANVDGLQSALDGKSATSHTHDSAYISKDLQMTADNGDISISWSGKDVVAQFKALASGMYTAYSPAGCTNNPNSNESFRFMIHKTGSANYGWVMAYGAQGSVYTGYIDNGNWKGWKALFEAAPQPLWTGASYMTDVHTITPSKTLSQCRNGWLLLWSDYDPGSGANNTDFYASVINKRAYTGQVWNGGEWYCDVPSYSAGTATDSEQRVIKLLKIYDSKIVGTPNNSAAPRNDVVLRAVYEW